MKLNKFIEHTLLKPEATSEEIKKLIQEAIDNEFLGVCINSKYVKFANELLKDRPQKVITVVGFPLCGAPIDVIAYEAKRALEDGADEIDMVINVGALKEGKTDQVIEEIKTVKAACSDKPLKVIFETDLLEQNDLENACKASIEAKADFVKTSTGFIKNGVGAKVCDVKFMADYVKDFGIKVKASGGIKNAQDALALIEAGASRLGTSSGVEIVKD